MIDLTTPHGQRVARQLAEERVIWLTTVGDDGTPHPSPVWFLWNGGELIIFSKPGAPKVRHIAVRPNIALNFNTDVTGEEVSVIYGAAALSGAALNDGERAAYLAKYADGIAGLGSTAERFEAEYSALIRIAPARLRGW